MAPSDTAQLIDPQFARTVSRDHCCSREARNAYLWHPPYLVIRGAWLREAGGTVAALDAIALGLDLEVVRHRVRRHVPALAVVLVSERTWKLDKQTLALPRNEGVETIAATGDFLRFGTGPMETLSLWSTLSRPTSRPGICIRASMTVHRPVSGVATVEQVQGGQFNDLGRQLLGYSTPDPTLFAPARRGASAGRDGVGTQGFARVQPRISALGAAYSGPGRGDSRGCGAAG